MNLAPLWVVIDASVAVKVFVPEALSAQAQKVAKGSYDVRWLGDVTLAGASEG